MRTFTLGGGKYRSTPHAQLASCLGPDASRLGELRGLNSVPTSTLGGGKYRSTPHAQLASCLGPDASRLGELRGLSFMRIVPTLAERSGASRVLNSMRVLLLLLLSTFFACQEEPARSSKTEQVSLVPDESVPIVPDDASMAKPRAKKSVGVFPFAEEIERFEGLDEANPVEPGRIVFVGSSSIRRWKSLAQDMAPLPVLNRGFGGSEFSDAIHYADRIITNYDPRIVVVYEGDNDLAHDNGKTAESVTEEAKTFVRILRDADPSESIVFLAIKPSPARMGRWPVMRKANELIRAYCNVSEGIEYIDVASHLFAKEGKLRSEAFASDGIHLSALGYREWTGLVRPRLEALLRPNL